QLRTFAQLVRSPLATYGCFESVGMSQRGQDRPSLPTSFDYLGGKLEKLQRHVETECLGGLEVDGNLKLRWVLHGQVGGPCALEYLVSVHRPLPALIHRIEPVGDQSALLGKKAEWIDRGQPIARCLGDDEVAVREG